MEGLEAGIMEVLQLPLAPFLEFVKALENLRFRDAIAVGVGRPVDRLLFRYMKQRDGLCHQRARVISHLREDGNSPQAVRMCRDMEAKFLELGQTYAARAVGCGSLPLEILADSRGSAAEMATIARDLEGALASQAPRRPQAPSPSDPKLLAALDRLGFASTDLTRLSAKAVGDRFRERAIQFHPDTKSQKDKGFYEDQMQRLNEAKDLLMAHLEGGAR